MRRTLTLSLLAGVVVTTAAASFLLLTAPPAALQLSGTLPPTTVLGGYHVHSSQSDGSGAVDAIARAAAAAGRQFVILTDHGDATAAPMPPVYLHGVLCIDAVEINTANGHVVALGIDRPAPFPLAGDGRDVIDDIHRFGGYAVAAHPDSPAASLRWRGPARYDGLEWINADGEWRDNAPHELFVAAVRSWRRGPEAIATLFSRPAFTLQRWDNALRSRRVTALAALDAHAHFGFGDADEPQGRTLVRWPSYETMFRTMAQAVELPAPLSGHAPADSAAVLDAIAAGRTYSIVTAIGSPAALEFTATQDGVVSRMGAVLENFDPAANVTIRAATPGVPGARIAVVRSGQTVADGRGAVAISRGLAAGAYRVEAYLPGNDMPWIVSNPIYLGTVTDDTPTAEIPPSTSQLIPVDAPWTVEKDPSSAGTLTREPPVLRFDYGLGSGAPAGQFSALTVRVPEDLAIDELSFVARASQPMRLSVQVRLPGSEGQRWRRSIFLDDTPQTIDIRVADMEPVGTARTLRPVAARLHSILFVVDTLNTSPGSRGTFWLRDVGVGIAKSDPTSGR